MVKEAVLWEAVLWWRKQCYGKGSSVMVEEAVQGSSVMVEEAVPW